MPCARASSTGKDEKHFGFRIADLRLDKTFRIRYHFRICHFEYLHNPGTGLSMKNSMPTVLIQASIAQSNWVIVRAPTDSIPLLTRGGIASLAPENRESRKVCEALARNDTIQRSHCEADHSAENNREIKSVMICKVRFADQAIIFLSLLKVRRTRGRGNPPDHGHRLQHLFLPAGGLLRSPLRTMNPVKYAKRSLAMTENSFSPAGGLLRSP